MTALAFDTSAAVPLLITSHNAHGSTRRHLGSRDAVLTAHSLAETYSVLTRLPGDARVEAHDAARLIEANFGPALVPPEATVRNLPAILAAAGVVGGAVYDAMVGLAAKAAGHRLVTRDARAIGTYAAIGVEIEIIEG